MLFTRLIGKKYFDFLGSSVGPSTPKEISSHGHGLSFMIRQLTFSGYLNLKCVLKTQLSPPTPGLITTLNSLTKDHLIAALEYHQVMHNQKK